MSLDAVFGVLFAALFGLLGVLWKVVWGKLQKIDSSALAQFEAKDTEREKAWWEWRRGLEDDRRSRHEEYNKRLDAHSAKLESHETRITKLERNGH